MRCFTENVKSLLLRYRTPRGVSLGPELLLLPASSQKEGRQY